MTFPAPRYITHDGFKLALYEEGPQDGVPILLIHGWPEMAYSWKNQIGVLAKAGYRAIAMDVRGFGRSSAPYGVEHYEISQLVSDVEAVLDDIGAETAVLIGHDWGGIIVWHAARMLAKRISHVISLCTPHVRRAPADPIDIFRARHGDAHYFVHFHDHPGKADALFASDPDSFFRMMFENTEPEPITSEAFHTPARFEAFLRRGTKETSSLIAEKDQQVYVEAYRKSGFHGGLNLYRGTSANWKLAEGLSDKITQPTLMISAEDDVFLPPAFADPMAAMVPNLTRYTIEGCGHWMMWEQPEAANKLVLDWLGRQFPEI
ncbi:MAG: alpha/beta fold hydrolase [Alphaproteobacteria bacterium]